jgi:hypothetical protein
LEGKVEVELVNDADRTGKFTEDLRPGADIIPLSSVRKRGNAAPAAGDPLTNDTKTDRIRVRQSIAALVLLAVLIAAGVWLMAAFKTASESEVCFEMGRRNCAPLNLDTRR